MACQELGSDLYCGILAEVLYVLVMCSRFASLLWATLPGPQTRGPACFLLAQLSSCNYGCNDDNAVVYLPLATVRIRAGIHKWSGIGGPDSTAVA